MRGLQFLAAVAPASRREVSLQVRENVCFVICDDLHTRTIQAFRRTSSSHIDFRFAENVGNGLGSAIFPFFEDSFCFFYVILQLSVPLAVPSAESTDLKADGSSFDDSEQVALGNRRDLTQDAGLPLGSFFCALSLVPPLFSRLPALSESLQ